MKDKADKNGGKSRCCAALLVLALACLTCAPLAAKAAPASLPPEQPGRPQEARLSNLEAVRLVDALMASGRLDEAAQICTLLLDSRDLEIRVEAIFRLGNIFYMLGEYDKAIANYLAIVNTFPGLTRVRLELARSYFEDEDYEKADFHFRLAQGDQELPEEVREKIDLFLQAIRRQKNWSLSTHLSIVPDSNLNYASGEERECIKTNYGLLCRELKGEDSGVGLRAGASGTHYQKIGKNVGIKSNASVSILDFERSLYDDNSLHLASGPRFIFSKGEVSLQPTYSARWVSGRDYSRSHGLRLDAFFDPAEQWALDVGLSYTINNYADEVVDSLLQGETFRAYAGVRHVLDSKSLVTAGLDFSNEHTRGQSFGSRTWGGNIGYYREFPHAFTAFVELGLSRSDYKAPAYFITADASIKEETRRDLVWQGYLRLSNRRWESSGFTPALSYTYTRRDSNIWNYGYDKHRIEFSIRQVF